MIGIYATRTLCYVLMIVVSGGFFIYIVFAGSLTWLKASHAGILQFHRLFHKVWYWFYYLIIFASFFVSGLNFTQMFLCTDVLKKSETSGVQAFQEFERTELEIPEELEETYFLEKMQTYSNKMEHHRRNGFFYLFMGILWFSMMMMNTGFITRKGYYPLGAVKPQRMVAFRKKGQLIFYRITGKKNKPFLKIKDTPENRRYYASLLQKRKERRVVCSVKK